MDKSLSIFLMIIFGMGGMTLVLLAWIQPMPAHERIFTTFVGSVGLVGVLIRALTLRPTLAN